MFFHQDIKGADLPPKTVCLTYDDGPGETAAAGPGPRTTELGRYLFDEGVPAAFFVIGRHAERYPATLARLRDWGHLIGNHTFSHPGLVALAEADGDVVGELARTDAVIRPFVATPFVLFRAPYGNWRQKAAPDGEEDRPTSVVADLLNRSGRFPDYVGPVNWDITAEDWECWKRGEAAEECARRYCREAERVGSGIILMHDSCEEADGRAKNQALAMTRCLMPLLKARGFRFVRLDEIPPIQAARRGRRGPEGPVFNHRRPLP